MTDFSIFLGRFHPLVVHLPIGIILLAALLEILSFSSRFHRLKQATPIVLLAAVVSALVAAFLGYLLSRSSNYDSTTLFWHEWLGFSVGIVTLIIWTLKHYVRFDKRVGYLSLSQYLLFFLVVMITVTGHLGGNLSRGSGYLVEYMPPVLKKIFNINTSATNDSLPASLDSVLVYNNIILPVLEKKCISCHNSKTQNGGLDLSDQASILKGGKAGPAVTPGVPDKSELFRRINLPETSKKHMPPNGKTPVDHVESAIIQWWIENGAAFDNKLAGLKPDQKMRFLLGTYLGINPEEQQTVVLPTVPPADSAVLKSLDAESVFIRKISEKSNLLDVSFTMSENTDETTRQSQFELLSKIKDQILWLNLSSCRLTDDDLHQFSEFPNLQRLRLEKNSITDSGIQYLKDLPNLEYLNIYQNPVTDQSIPIFQQMAALKKLYVWGTDLSDDGIARLKSNKPGLEVVK